MELGLNSREETRSTATEASGSLIASTRAHHGLQASVLALKDARTSAENHSRGGSRCPAPFEVEHQVDR